MDARDLLKKLTCGAKFSKANFAKNKSKLNKTVTLPQIKQEEIDVKEEDDDEDTFLTYDDKKKVNDWINSSTSPFDDEIKTEIKSESDDNDLHNDPDEVDESPLKILDNITEMTKQKKKKVMTKEKQKLLDQEEINRLRNVHHISAIGFNISPILETFDEMAQKYQIGQNLLNNLAICGYSTPTPIQMQAIPVLLEKKTSLMACAPTGSGKTAAFLLPIIRDLVEPKRLGFRALILCPTRELARQTLRECSRLTEGINFKLHIITKTNKIEEKYSGQKMKKYDILITTPNRVCFLLDQGILDLSNIQWLIIDEADKLFENGVNSFREQFDRILTACSNPKKRVALFSATYTPTVASWCKKNLKNLIRITVGVRNSATDSVEQELLFVGTESGKLLAFRDLIQKGLQPPVLVFVQSKDRAQQLFNELIYDGINVDVIHADRTQDQRDSVVRAFREGKIWVLICTELMSRGIDFKGVNLVINYDFPSSSISYVHRIGRAGRAGRRGKAITFFTKNDTANLRNIAQIIKNSGSQVPDYMLTLKKRSKSLRKKLMKEAPKREAITTTPAFELQRRAKKKKMIARTKAIKEGRITKRQGGKKKDNKNENMNGKRKIINKFVKNNKKQLKKPIVQIKHKRKNIKTKSSR